MAKSFKIVDFEEGISGEEALFRATRNLRELAKTTTEASKTIQDDAARIGTSLNGVNQAIATIQGKAGRLDLFSGQDKAVLATLAQQLGDLAKQQQLYKEAQAGTATVQAGITQAVKQYNSELAANKQALRDAQKAGDVEAQKKAAAAIRQTAQETRDLNAALRGSNSSLTAAKGSYDALVIENNKLTATLRGLGDGLASTSDEAIRLQLQINKNNDTLKTFDQQLGLNYRNVGNYAQSFEGLIKELARARLAQQGYAEGTAQAVQGQQRILGFQTAAQKSAAQMGLSYEQAEAKINAVTGAIQPLTTALLGLEKEQLDIALTAGKESEAFQKIGFQIQATKTKIDEVATATAHAGESQGKLTQQLGFTKEGLSQYITQLAVGAIGLQALAQAAGAAFQANVDYSRNLAEVRKSSGLTADEAERLAGSLKDLSTPTNLAGLLKIASVGGQLGIAKGDLLEFTKAVDIANQALGNDGFSGGAEK